MAVFGGSQEFTARLDEYGLQPVGFDAYGQRFGIIADIECGIGTVGDYGDNIADVDTNSPYDAEFVLELETMEFFHNTLNF